MFCFTQSGERRTDHNPTHPEENNNSKNVDNDRWEYRIPGIHKGGLLEKEISVGMKWNNLEKEMMALAFATTESHHRRRKAVARIGNPVQGPSFLVRLFFIIFCFGIYSINFHEFVVVLFG
jgi:hypothetical protein